jgi:hypothetical protein
MRVIAETIAVAMATPAEDLVLVLDLAVAVLRHAEIVREVIG